MKLNEFVTVGEAAKILGLSEGGARYVLGEPHGEKRAQNNQLSRAWKRTTVLAVKEARIKAGKKMRPPGVRRSYKRRTKIKSPNKRKDYFEVDSMGNVVPMKRIYRGRICRHPTCNNPVATGFLFCDEHRMEFEAMKRNVATYGDEYPCHI